MAQSLWGSGVNSGTGSIASAKEELKESCGRPKDTVDSGKTEAGICYECLAGGSGTGGGGQRGGMKVGGSGLGSFGCTGQSAMSGAWDR